jgi:hypothetical protein
MSENWDKINFAADGSRVLLTLLVTRNEQSVQAQLDRMSVEDLEVLTAWSEILGTLAYYTKMRKIHEE